MMPREPDRFDKQAREFKARFWRIESGWDKDMDEEDIAAALRAEHASALERAAQICRRVAREEAPRSQVGKHAALRCEELINYALIPPAAAPAAEALQHECRCGQRIVGGDEDGEVIDGMRHTWSYCELAPAAETGKAQGAEAPDWWWDAINKCAKTNRSLLARIAELEDLLRGIEKTLAGQREREGASPGTVSDIVFKIVRKLAARAAAPEREGT